MNRYFELSKNFFLLAAIICFSLTGFSIQADPVTEFHLSQNTRELPLVGNWLFSKQDQSIFKEPAFDDSAWDIIPVPGQWTSLGLTGFVTCWYRQDFKLHPSHRDEPFALRMPMIAEAYEVYINGKLIGKQGSISKQGAILIKNNRPMVYEIPSDVLNFFEDNTIAVRVADDVGWGGFVTWNFALGYNYLVQEEFRKYLMWNAGLVLVFYFNAMFYFIQFLGRKQEKSYLYFALFALFGGNSIFGSLSLPYWIINDFWFNHFIYHGSFNITAVFLILFMHSFFNVPHNIFSQACNYLIPLLFGVVLLTPFHLKILKFYAHISFPITLVVMLLTMIYLVGIIAISVRQRKIGARTILVGFLILAIFTLSPILSYLGLAVNTRNLINIGSMVFMISMAIALAFKMVRLYELSDRHADELEDKVAKRTQQLTEQKQKAEELLLNILPPRIADELKQNGVVKPMNFSSATILFTDFVGFTKFSQTMAPNQLVTELDGYFTYFDDLMLRNNIEKLKTIGDSYMCVGGVPQTNQTHPIDACMVALGIKEFIGQIRKIKEQINLASWEIRVGIHTGPVTAGIIGKHKWSYDIWGDSVNTASRMEAGGQPGEINLSGVTYELVKDVFDCIPRGKLKVKGKEDMEMYFLSGLKSEFMQDDSGLIPNEKFKEIYNRGELVKSYER